MKKALTAAFLFLNGIGAAYAETEIDRLVSSSQAIAEKLRAGYAVAAGAGHYAVQGGIPVNGVSSQGIITTVELDNYNQALSNVQNAVYYNTQMMLEDKHEEAMIDLDIAIDAFVEASQEIMVAVEVAEVAETTDQSNVDSKQDLQEYITTNDVEITQQEVNEYNSALNDVETYAQDAAAYLAASRNVRITEDIDNDANRFNERLTEVNVTYNATQQSVAFYFQNGYSHTFYGFLDPNIVSQQEIMGMGESIYQDTGWAYQ